MSTLFCMQCQKSELESELCDQRDQNTDLQEKSRDLEEENRDLKELIDQMEKETNVRLHVPIALRTSDGWLFYPMEILPILLHNIIIIML